MFDFVHREMNKEPTELLTVYAIAKLSGRTQSNIHQFLRRHGIEAVQVDERRSLYPQEALAMARKLMRAQNGSCRNKRPLTSADS